MSLMDIKGKVTFKIGKAYGVNIPDKMKVRRTSNDLVVFFLSPLSSGFYRLGFVSVCFTAPSPCAKSFKRRA